MRIIRSNFIKLKLTRVEVSEWVNECAYQLKKFIDLRISVGPSLYVFFIYAFAETWTHTHRHAVCHKQTELK